MGKIWKSLADVKKMVGMIYGTGESVDHMDDCGILLPISVGHLNVVESLQPSFKMHYQKKPLFDQLRPILPDGTAILKP